MMIYVILDWLTCMILVVALKYNSLSFAQQVNVAKLSSVSNHVMAELKTST